MVEGQRLLSCHAYIERDDPALRSSQKGQSLYRGHSHRVVDTENYAKSNLTTKKVEEAMEKDKMEVDDVDTTIVDLLSEDSLVGGFRR